MVFRPRGKVILEVDRGCWHARGRIAGEFDLLAVHSHGESRGNPGRQTPGAGDVDRLIHRSGEHPLGRLPILRDDDVSLLALGQLILHLYARRHGCR